MRQDIGLPFFCVARDVVLVLASAATAVLFNMPMWAASPNGEALGPVPPGLIELGIKTKCEALQSAYHRWSLNPNDSQVRRELARIYSKPRGYGSLSTFFDLTADFLDGDVLVLEKGPGIEDAVPCSLYSGPFSQVRERSRMARVAAEELAAQSRNGELLPLVVAIDADKAIDTYGNHCGLLAEWSLANLRFSLHNHQNTIDSEREELALRLLVTLAEGGTSPSGYNGTAPVYHFLSEYFTVRQDYVSAYVAGLLARQRLSEGSSTGFWDDDSLAEALSSQLESLEPFANRMRDSRPRPHQDR